MKKNSKIKSTSSLFKDKVKEKIQEIKDLDLKRKITQVSNTISSEDFLKYPLTFSKWYFIN
jgi:hypothetical protein